MTTQKLTSLMQLAQVLLTLVLIAEPALAQSTTNLQKSPDLASSALAPLRLGPYATKPLNSPDRVGRDAVALGLATTKVYKFASADYPGSPSSLVFDENLSTILGDTDFSFVLGFTLQGGNYRLLNLPGSQDSLATGINTSGQIVGSYRDVGGTLHGFLYSGGVVTNIDDPSATTGTTNPNDLNDSGKIVGSYTDSTNVMHGFSTPDGINFTTIDVPGAVGTQAAGVDTAGDIVGLWQDGSGNNHGFLLKGGVFTTIDFPLATSTAAIGINDFGEISGYFGDASKVNHGFLLTGNSFAQVDVVGASSTQLTRVKNNGRITGVYADTFGEMHGLTGH